MTVPSPPIASILRHRRYGRTAALLLRPAAQMAVATLFLAATPGIARPESLRQAMADSYQGNPTLAAARDKVRVADEKVSVALSAMRPTLGLQGSLGRLTGHQWETFAAYGVAEPQSASFRYDPRKLQASASQALYRAGALSAAVRAAEAQVGVQLAQSVGTEQDVLFQVGAAAANIALAEAGLALAQEYEAALAKVLEGVSLMARYQDRAVTDVAQAQSRLSSARADLSQARARLASAHAAFEAVVGRPAAGIPDTRGLPLPAPDEGAAIAIALQRNPAVVAARHALDAAHAGVDVAVGNWLPAVDASATYLYAREAAIGTIREQDREAWVRVTIPLFSGGGSTAVVRQSGYLVAQRRFDLEDSEAATTATVRQAWQGLATARQVVATRAAQSEAATRAHVSVDRQHRLGMRSFLETLDALRDSVNGRGTLAKAQNALTIAELKLLASTGGLTATQLALPVTLWDNATFLRAARRAWLDLGQ